MQCIRHYWLFIMTPLRHQLGTGKPVYAPIKNQRYI